MSDAMTQHTPADVRELAVEIIRSLDLIARNYDSYEYGLPVMTHYDEMVDTVVALLRTPRGEGERGLIMRAMLETFPWSPDIRQEHFERAADAVIAALRSEAQGELDKLRELICDVAASGVVVDDARLRYVEIQVDRQTWDEVCDLAARRQGGSDG